MERTCPFVTCLASVHWLGIWKSCIRMNLDITMPRYEVSQYVSQQGVSQIIRVWMSGLRSDLDPTMMWYDTDKGCHNIWILKSMPMINYFLSDFLIEPCNGQLHINWYLDGFELRQANSWNIFPLVNNIFKKLALDQTFVETPSMLGIYLQVKLFPLKSNCNMVFMQVFKSKKLLMEKLYVMYGGWVGMKMKDG